MTATDACFPLEDRREKFAQGVAAGMRQTAAARQAGYSEGYSAVTACGLLKVPSVVARIAWLKEQRRLALARLDEAHDAALAAGDAASALRAVQMQATLAGLLPADPMGGALWA